MFLELEAPNKVCTRWLWTTGGGCPHLLQGVGRGGRGDGPPPVGVSEELGRHVLGSNGSLRDCEMQVSLGELVLILRRT